MVTETFNYTKINVIEESKQRRWVDVCIVATGMEAHRSIFMEVYDKVRQVTCCTHHVKL
jgi:hypothetical protein